MKNTKRAANRRSAQLSRKKKKMQIDDLKDENSDLRRKELILLSIPDLIVVFDSSGVLSYVSRSVSRFLNFDAEELEGSSFWDRISDDSVRAVKAAFMDALAVKRREGGEEDSTPLSSGDNLSVRLLDRSMAGGEEGKHASLKGVVSFAGDRPECVCSIRPSSSETTPRNREGPTPSSALTEIAPPLSHHISDVDSERS